MPFYHLYVRLNLLVLLLLSLFLVPLLPASAIEANVDAAALTDDCEEEKAKEAVKEKGAQNL
jgi:hypothetical protein